MNQASNLKSEKIFHVISNTHWDREWRFPFQRNRQMLVEMIDEVISILQKEPKYRAFHLDSQSIVVKDYLEAKPHNKEIFSQLVNEKRIFIGPWYVLPEQFQIGGENLIRNLLIGHKLCKEIGRVSKMGYSPFSWGQISQLPQIYKEFGIELIMFYRGVNSLDSPKAEFLWIGADGTGAISSRFSTMPRYNFYFYLYRMVIHNENISDVRYTWEKGGTHFHFADESLCAEDYFILNPVDGYFPENIKQQVEAIIKDQANDFTTPHVIWMEGHDSSGPNIKTVQLLDDIKKEFPNMNVIHSTLEDYAEAIYSSVDKNSLQKVFGERRSSQFDRSSGNMYGYTTSARMFLKQKNFEAERWLQYFAEPFNSFASLIGADVKNNYLDIAWDLLVQNSSHDSIGGCSLDEIHDDMMNRYKQCIEISRGVFSKGIQEIVKRIDVSSFSNNHNIYLTALNPNNNYRSEVVTAFIDIPVNLDKGSFSIINSDGNSLQFEILSKRNYQPVLEQMIDRPMYHDMIRYETKINIEDVPPFGYKVFSVEPCNQFIEKKNSLPKQNLFMENEFLKVKINANGTFNLYDKKNDLSFNNLGYFFSEGEAGHAWINVPTKPFVTTLKSKAKISVVEQNSLSSTFRIIHKLLIPKNLAERKKSKQKLVKVDVELFLTLKYKSKRLNIEINVDNKAESHRLRIMFPTKIENAFSFGEGQFDVVQRSTERIDSSNWIEQPMYDFPMHNFVDVSNKEKGISLLVDGLKEYEVLNDKKKTLAITLLRGFEYIIAPSSRQDYTHQKGSQSLGKTSYRLSIYSHKKSWFEANTFNEAFNFNYEMKLVQSGYSSGELPLAASFLRIKPEELIFSTLKLPENKNENELVLRIFNPSENKIDGKVQFMKNILCVQKVTLEEIHCEEIKLINSNVFPISLEKKKIGTYKITFGDR